MLIAITEVKDKLEIGDSLDGRLKEAMKLAKNHWLVTDESKRFDIAIASVMLVASAEDKERLAEELGCLKMLSSSISGVPINLSEFKLENPIGLLKMWKEID